MSCGKGIVACSPMSRTSCPLSIVTGGSMVVKKP
jgi:hypothetical protein